MARPRRVLFINHNKLNAGTYFRCLRLAIPLARSGEVAVEILCCTRDERTLRIERHAPAPGVTVTAVPHLPQGLGYLGTIIRGLVMALLLLARPKRARPERIHAFALAWPSVAIPALAARWLLGIPCATDWDDVWGDGYASFLSPVVNWAIRTAEDVLPSLLRADFMTVASRELEARACERSGIPRARVAIVRNGCDPAGTTPRDPAGARARLGIAPAQPLLVSIGHTYTPLSLAMLVAAVKPIVAKRPDARLVLVGDFAKAGHFGQLIQGILDRSGLGAALVVTGEIPFDRVLDYMAAASALALPMEDTLIDRARSPIRLGDYLASGGVVVSNAVGEVRDVLEELGVGLVSPAGDRDGFTRNLERALDDPDLRQTIGKKSREAAVYRHCWERYSAVLAGVYRERWGFAVGVSVPEPNEPRGREGG